MEINIIGTVGLDDEAIVSIQSGGVRKQGALNAKRAIRFPASPEGANPLKVDVLNLVASSIVEIGPHSEVCSVHFPAAPGASPKAITFQVKDTSRVAGRVTGAEESELAGLSPSPAGVSAASYSGKTLQEAFPAESSLQRRDASAAAARNYLQSTGVLKYMQELLRSLVRDRPEDPFLAISEHVGVHIKSRGCVDDTLAGTKAPVPDDLSAHPAFQNEPAVEEEPSAQIKRQSAVAVAAAFSESLFASTDALELRRLGTENEQLRQEIGELRKLLVEMQSSGSHEEVSRLRVEVGELRSLCEERRMPDKMEPCPEDQLGDVPAKPERRPETKIWLASTWCSEQGVQDDSAKQVEAPESDGGEDELGEKDKPKTIVRARGRGVSAEAYGAWNKRRAAFVPPAYKKSLQDREGLLAAFANCPLFSHIEREILNAVVGSMPVIKYPAGTRILKQGDDGDSLFVLLRGSVDLYDDRDTPPKFIVTLPSGRVFGELAMLYSTPRMLSVHAREDCVMGQLSRIIYQNLIVRHQIRQHEQREECMRQVRVLDTMSVEQIAQLADMLERRVYESGDVIVQQGDPGNNFFIVQSGECSATVQISDEGSTSTDIQEHRRYVKGDLFGERALLESTVRAATVTALGHVEVLSLSRKRFERMLGPLDLLQKQHYMTDPRRRIAEFYKSGNKRGTRGSCIKLDPAFRPEQVPEEERTDWFCVYRPTSRDAIAKMLSGSAVGKGLNIKGKSAKRGRQQGFVPFLQISNEQHKAEVSRSPPDARSRIFFSSEGVREEMLRDFEPLLDPANGISITGDRVIFYIDQYPNMYGLDVPEIILRELFMDRPDISFRAGWETGRSSEPAFMEMNWASLRGNSEPQVVLVQADLDDPRNPHGLLMAYAEEEVKPVVSDFDTFLVGSRNMTYHELPREQAEIAFWALQNTQAILSSPSNRSWTSRWLDVIKQAKFDGFCPRIPPLGYSDDIACRLIREVMEATHESGAVRHGAECFNYYFPQELEHEYLVVWPGFQSTGTDGDGEKTWEYLDEDDLRDFLWNRIQEGYCFPLNPIWLVRDPGWYEIYEALIDTEQGKGFISKVFLDSVGIKEKIEEIHGEHPEGFMVEVTLGGHRKSALLDMDKFERADLAMTGLEQVALDGHRAGNFVSKFEPLNNDGKKATIPVDVDVDDTGDLWEGLANDLPEMSISLGSARAAMTSDQSRPGSPRVRRVSIHPSSLPPE